MSLQKQGWVSWIGTPFVGLVGAWLATLAGWPLPWITGSLVAIAVVRCAGWKTSEIPYGRLAGQWLIATSIGLHFTRAMLLVIAGYAPLMAVAALSTLAMALLGIALMKRMGMDMPTAYFSFMPANFAEMINLGSYYRADVSKIAASHALRLALIVLIVPALAHIGAGPGEAQAPEVAPVHWGWILGLLVCGACMASLWQRIGLPNAWMFGPMLICAILTATFEISTRLPSPLGACGQLMIGCALGCHFDRGFFRRAPLYLFQVTCYCMTMIALTFFCAYLLSILFRFPFLTLALGMMPGSTTEMYLTAEALKLDAGLVTAMQITRLIVIMAFAEPVFKRWSR